MKQFGLDKRHKLCSLTDIDLLFKGQDAMTALAYPLRAVWRLSENRRDGLQDVSKFLISVPKKRLRHAVDRVTMRRRIREAYRLNHAEAERLNPNPPAFDIAFIYVADSQRSYAQVEAAMKRLLCQIHSAAKKRPEQ